MIVVDLGQNEKSVRVDALSMICLAWLLSGDAWVELLILTEWDFRRFLCVPRRAQLAQQEVVRAVVAGDLPGQHEEDGEYQQKSVAAGRPCHDEVPVHERT